ncbi:hypothetical protein CAL12_22315 [Bordetella genomosp. 8]|uniref:DUF2950 domain-containing protein n=1 Tax=Bordetella genomosp. 8 TaxID=1416806 RepID=A0A1W6YUC2_9BORD|nr:DUF2950 domain-containing protein [Bordetella genomosp. 8]ARP84687.1 hypothetical protein CAL12_22315 [Bordetella genomosp. 8]
MTTKTAMAAVAMTAAMAIATAHGQEAFPSPTAAMNEFGTAIAKRDESALRRIFGNDFRALIPVTDTRDREAFIMEWGRSHTIEMTDADHALIAVGKGGWTFPIPLVRHDGGWRFDTRAGTEEMRLRRVGRNELAVIQAMLAVYDAQREYAQTTHDGGSLLVYASKLVSSPGKHDGLYWPTLPGEPESPLGPAFAAAASSNAAEGGFHGYHFKLLKSQSAHAPGGAYDYVVRGKLFGGFAVIAWPVRYGDTGIETFIVSHAGQLYQRDLGADSASLANAIRQFDPGPGWSKVPEQDSRPWAAGSLDRSP